MGVCVEPRGRASWIALELDSLAPTRTVDAFLAGRITCPDGVPVSLEDLEAAIAQGAAAQ